MFCAKIQKGDEITRFSGT